MYNTPIDPEYLAILQLPHMSADSRLLNERLAMGTLGVSPSRSMGGLGFHKQRFGHVSLLGKTYCLMYGLGSNNTFDNILLPYSLLLDGAAADANGLVWSSHHANQIFKHQLAPVAPRARYVATSCTPPPYMLRPSLPPPSAPPRRSMSLSVGQVFPFLYVRSTS